MDFYWQVIAFEFFMLRRLHADDTQDFNDAIHSPVLLLEEED